MRRLRCGTGRLSCADNFRGLEPYAGKLARTVLRGGYAGNGVSLPALVTSFKPRKIVENVEILTEPERRRRRSAQEKLAIVQEAFEPGATVSAVARRHGLNANQVFAWRKQYEEGSLAAVKAGGAVVPASQLAAAMKEIRDLQRLLGKKTQEAEILRELPPDHARGDGVGICRWARDSIRSRSGPEGKRAGNVRTIHDCHIEGRPALAH
jgi:transposase